MPTGYSNSIIISYLETRPSLRRGIVAVVSRWRYVDCCHALERCPAPAPTTTRMAAAAGRYTGCANCYCQKWCFMSAL